MRNNSIKKIAILLVLCGVTGGCSTSTIQTFQTGIKNIFTSPETKRQAALRKQVDSEIDIEMNKVYKGEYQEFAINLQEPFNTYEAVWNNIGQTFQKADSHQLRQGAEKQISLRSPQKNNMLVNALILEDLTLAEDALSTALDHLQKGICNGMYASFDVWKISQGQSSSTKWLCEQNPKYQVLIKQLEDVKQLKETIYEHSYQFERNKFIMATGFDIAEMRNLNETLFNYMTVTPKANDIFSLENTKVLQSTSEGILVGGNTGLFDGEIYPDKVAFVYTQKNFVDGQSLQGTVQYVGAYDYMSILGVHKRVNAYRFFTFNWKNYKLNPNDFYFYPTIKDIKNIDMEKVINSLIKIDK